MKTGIYHHFDFLNTEYNFSRTDNQSWPEVHYERDSIYVDVGFEKGRLLVMLGTTSESAVLKPYVSRYFDLHRIVLAQDKNGFSDYPGEGADANTTAVYLAAKLKRYADSILRGEISLFEKMVIG